MSQEIYDETIGAQSAQLFGCTLQNISMQMGFDDQPTVVNIKVVEESGQTFTLNSNDIQSVQNIQFSSLEMLGIVQSWDRVNVDMAGTGTYTIKLTDCRLVLDAVTAIINPATPWDNSQASEDEITDGDYGENIIPMPLPTEQDFDFGLPFSQVKIHLDQALMYYGNEIFELDVSALSILPYEDTGRGAPVRIDGPTKTVSEIISEICHRFGYQWWVECRYKFPDSTTDRTIVLEVKIISRISQVGDEIGFTLDTLAALHGNTVITRKDGHENKDEVTKTILQGGVRRHLFFVPSQNILPFWGWNEAGTAPLGFPAYQDPHSSIYKLISTSILQMKEALNGEYNDEENRPSSMTEERLQSLKSYAGSHWGKRFYLRLAPHLLDSDNKSWVKSIPAGWWESDTPPANLNSVLAYYTFCSEDGRWKPFMKFPTVAYKWNDNILTSENVIRQESVYSLCSLKQQAQYVIMELSVPIEFITTSNYEITVSNAQKKINRSTNQSGAWIPFMDSRYFYGPWSSDIQTPPTLQKRGRTRVLIDGDLVPWKHGFRGITNTQGMSDLNWIAEGRIHSRTAEDQIINTGQMEVADIPRINIGQAIHGGSNITNISTQFGINGITTRYVMNLYTDELGNLRSIERKRNDEMFRALRAIKAKVSYKQHDNIQDEFKTLLDKHRGPADIPTDYIFNREAGGLGVIITSAAGPFYDIRRINYKDVGSSTTENVSAYPTWGSVRNLSEPLNSQGMLQPGQTVTVEIYSESKLGPFVPYIEQAPQFFAPPPLGD